MKTLIATTAIALCMAATNAFAFGDVEANAKSSSKATAVAGAAAVSASSLNASFKNYLAQRQKQQQGQAQGQYVDNADSFNSTINFDSRPNGPSLATALAGLPSFANAGNRNACAGSEAWTGSIGGSVGLSGGQISGAGGLLGWGENDVIEIEGCEKREATALMWEMGLKEGAIAVACTHKYMAIGVNKQFPGTCASGGTVASVSTVPARAPEKQTASTGGDFDYLD